MLVGDFVYSPRLPDDGLHRVARVMEIMADATNVIAEGEVLQLMNAQDPDTTEERYLQVIYRKTARLFEAGAGEVAAVLAGSSPEVQRALARLWQNTLGTAFQLIDDVLDYRSDPASRGKNLGEDLAEGKMTLPLIHTLRTASDADGKMIRAAITQAGDESAPEPDLARIIACTMRRAASTTTVSGRWRNPGGDRRAGAGAGFPPAATRWLRWRTSRCKRSVTEAPRLALNTRAHAVGM